MTIKEERELWDKIEEKKEQNKEKSKVIAKQLLKENPFFKISLYVFRLTIALNSIAIAMSTYLFLAFDNDTSLKIYLGLFIQLMFVIIHSIFTKILLTNINENEDANIKKYVSEYLDKPAFLLFVIPLFSVLIILCIISQFC